MPRPGRAWFRTSHGRWYATVGGRQRPLDVTDPNGLAAAEAARQRLVDELAAAVAAKLSADRPGGRQTVSGAVAAYLAHQRDRLARGLVKRESVRCYGTALKPLAEGELAGRELASVTGPEFEAWAARPGWSSTTRATYLSVVLGLLRWAGVPTRVGLPPVESRGAETCLTDAQFAEVLAALPTGKRAGDLRELLVALRETGARPQELAGLAAEAVDRAGGCALLSQHKGRRHTARRTVYFNTAALAVLEAQRRKYGSGLLFRTRYGRQYRPKFIIKALLKVSKKLGFRVIAYGLGRHSFATRALVAGVPDAIVAELLGHRGTAMVTAHYGHVGAQSRVLREAAEKAATKRAG